LYANGLIASLLSSTFIDSRQHRQTHLITIISSRYANPATFFNQKHNLLFLKAIYF